jgi:hypothetical protein
VPIGHLPLDGNAAEAPTHLDNLRRLRAMLPKQKLLYIADTKLDTPAKTARPSSAASSWKASTC